MPRFSSQPKMRESRLVYTWLLETETWVCCVCLSLRAHRRLVSLTSDSDIVKLLTSQFSSRPKEEKQAYLDAPNEFGNTGLHWAALGGHLEVVKFLTDEGASPALANDKNYIPLDLASFGEKTNVVDFFLSQMEKMEGSNEDEGLESATAGVALAGEEDADEAGKDIEKA